MIITALSLLLGATPSVVKRELIMPGRKAGTCVTSVAGDGTITVALKVVENGRGPQVDTTIRLAADGTIAMLAASGQHEMGTKVAEEFSREGNKVAWKSSEENGARELKGAALYIPSAQVPEIAGIAVKALIKNGGTLPLLPAGEAKLEKSIDATVELNGKPTHLQMYSINGVDLRPMHVWMQDDGNWFGFVSNWMSIVPEGADKAIEPLLKKQNELDESRQQALATQVAQKPAAAGVALAHARVLDVEKGVWLADQTVLIVGNTIKSVGPSSAFKAPVGVEVRDLAGRAILPGLIDMHGHLSDEDGAINIASGVTSVRDVGNDPDRLDLIKKHFDEGTTVGPHVYRMGFIEGRNEKAASSKVTAETPQEAKDAVAYYAKRGYDGIKIYNSVKVELVPLLAKDAHARGMQVTGHIPVHMLANEAVKAGYDGIEHINMLFLNFFATHDTDTRDTTRFTLVGDKAATFDLQSKLAKDFIALLRDKKTVVDPTLGAFEELYIGKPGEIMPTTAHLVSRLPPQAQRGFLRGGLPMDGKEELYKQSWDKLLAMVKLLNDEKVTIVAGTDALAGLWMHHELELFVQAGIPPAQALRMATIVPARVLKQDKKIGSVAAGKVADLFIVDGDPLANIKDVGKVVTTFKSGVAYDAKPLYDWVSVSSP